MRGRSPASHVDRVRAALFALVVVLTPAFAPTPTTPVYGGIPGALPPGFA